MRDVASVLLAVLLLPACATADPDPATHEGRPISGTVESLPALGLPDDEMRDLRSFALAQSPDVLAANRATMVALARARQAGLFPNPVLTYAFTDLALGSGDRSSAVKQVMGVAQAFPLSDRIGAAKREAESEAELARAQMDLARRELVVKIDEELAQYARARERARLTERQLERLRALETSQAGRVAAGEGVESDLSYTRVELEKTRLDSEEAARKVATAEKVLEATVGRELDMTKLKVDLPARAPPIDETALLEKARAASPAVILLERQAETARATLRRAREERVPDVTVALWGGYLGAARSPVVEGGIAIPLPLFNRNQYQVEASLREVERADRALAGERITAAIACAETARDYESARLRVDAFGKKIIPAAEENVRRSVEAFRAGKIPDRDVLVAERNLIELEMELVDARLALARAIARIERLTGAPVPERK